MCTRDLIQTVWDKSVLKERVNFIEYPEQRSDLMLKIACSAVNFDLQCLKFLAKVYKNRGVTDS